jgi:hypothetical protein
MSKTVKQVATVIASFVVIYYISTHYETLKEAAKK